MTERDKVMTISATNAKFAGVLAGLSFAAVVELSGRTPMTTETTWAFNSLMIAGLFNAYAVLSFYQLEPEAEWPLSSQFAAWAVGYVAFSLGIYALVASVNHRSAIIGAVTCSILNLLYVFRSIPQTWALRVRVKEIEAEQKNL